MGIKCFGCENKMNMIRFIYRCGMCPNCENVLDDFLDKKKLRRKSENKIRIFKVDG